MSSKRIVLIALFLALFSIPFVLLVFWLIGQFMLIGFALPYALLSESTQLGYVRIALFGTLLNAVPIVFTFYWIRFEVQIETFLGEDITAWLIYTALAELIIIGFFVLGFAFSWSV